MVENFISQAKIFMFNPNFSRLHKLFKNLIGGWLCNDFY